jgi:hypothetical protein
MRQQRKTWGGRNRADQNSRAWNEQQNQQCSHPSTYVQRYNQGGQKWEKCVCRRCSATVYLVTTGST